MSPIITIILDLVIVGLLAATIAYAIILNKQIIRLRESRGEMNDLIQGLNEAMGRAETGVRGLKKTAHDTGEDLQRTVAKAQTLRDELEFMIEAADALANRLGAVAGDRQKPGGVPQRPAAGRPGLSVRPTVATRPLIEDDHDDHEEDHDDGPLGGPLGGHLGNGLSLRGEPLRADPPMRRPAPPTEPRDPIVREGESLSRAERELLQAIENAGKGVG